ncbi:hypothetical protein, partial [Klebsiella pneumoniae]|uniref:hypothetical protein n=1 Tax=Klebsiella pneumoniae TaxID=573 RepID=UPI003136DB46
GDLLDDVARKIIGFLLRVFVGAKRIVAMCFHGESVGPRGVWWLPDVADVYVDLVGNQQASVNRTASDLGSVCQKTS